MYRRIYYSTIPHTIISLMYISSILMTDSTDFFWDAADVKYMHQAIELASKALGKTSPNPCVGCVILDKDGVKVGEGFHAKAGQPHAEVAALQQAGKRAVGGTAYVSLEPCNHHGRTPPCSHALVRCGIARIVAGMVDPDPRVSGSGLEYLRDIGGLEVVVGVLREECMRLNLPFIFRVQHRRPFVTCWLGMSRIGRLSEVCPSSVSALIEDLLPEVDCLLLSDRQLPHLSVLDIPSHIQLVINASDSAFEFREARQKLMDYLLLPQSLAATTWRSRRLTVLFPYVPPDSSHSQLESVAANDAAAVVHHLRSGHSDLDLLEAVASFGCNSLLCLPEKSLTSDDSFLHQKLSDGLIQRLLVSQSEGDDCQLHDLPLALAEKWLEKIYRSKSLRSGTRGGKDWFACAEFWTAP